MNQNQNAVSFYNVYLQPFSNFFQSPFKVGDKEYKTAEHYYQSMKFKGTEDEDKIRQTQTIESCHFMGQMHSAQFDSKKWDEIREKVYEEAVRYKFTQNLQLAKMLKNTGQKEIICIDEDSFWGMKFSYTTGQLEGQNTTGKILMRVRKELSSQQI